MSPKKIDEIESVDVGNTEPLIVSTARSKRWIWIGGGILLFILIVGLGAFIGYSAGIRSRINQQEDQIALTATTQFQLGLEDLNSGRYEMARRRFEYVVQIDPSFPGVTDKLSESMLKIAMVQTSTENSIPTVTVTPTIDYSDFEDLFNQAYALLKNNDWNGAIAAIDTLRAEDHTYRAVEVDGLYYIALRFRGVDKIIKEGNLEGGIYDLTLVERFGPIDTEADGFRNWARLYLTGTSFWGIDWSQVVYYFSQVASALPNLTGGGNWTATERYRVALIHYGDQLLIEGNYCGARDQYQLSLRLGQEPNLAPTATQAQILCEPPTATAAPVIPTSTPSPTSELGVGVTESPPEPTQEG